MILHKLMYLCTNFVSVTVAKEIQESCTKIQVKRKRALVIESTLAILFFRNFSVERLGEKGCGNFIFLHVIFVFLVAKQK